MRLFFLDPRSNAWEHMGGSLASRPGGRLKRGSGFDLTSLCCYGRFRSMWWVECSVRNGQAWRHGVWGSGALERVWRSGKGKRSRAHTREPQIGFYDDLGLVTAVVAKHTVMHCLGGSSLVSLGLWTILNS